MSGTTTNATTNYDAHIFTGKRSEFGMLKFADPHRQSTYGSHEIRYKKMLTLKMAYDKQEFLRKMRADIKREYLTRKKQLKKLQMDAAVVFRNAEYSLQEHYSSFATERRIDINAPLISQIELPHGDVLDLKTFNQEREFGKVCQAHEDLRIDCEESAKYWEEQAQAQLRRDTEEKTSEILWNELVAERCLGCGDLECSDCYSYGYGYDNDNDGGDSVESGDSYDSGYFPCQYDYDREEREAREKWEALPPQQQEQLWEENTRDSDGETWDEEARADEAEYRRELAELHAQMETGDDYPHVAQVTEPKERITVAAAGGTISAKTKAKSKTKAAAAAKARIAKQQLNKQTKFVPIQITVNTNRSDVDEAASAMLYTGKVQINLPKKNYQIVGAKSEAAAREAKKRDAAKWKRINTADKQSNARGTRIANIPVPRAWHNCGGGSDCE
jgi:hypothetical protein